MCTFLYLFVVYFSFAPIISASIHRYVNYFDIQVLMMVTETETLTSTLHHNKFTYLDYVFSATFLLSDFNPYLLSLCPFGKTNTKYNLTRHLSWTTSKRSTYIGKFTCRCVFLDKREVLSRFFGKSNIFKYVSTCQTRSYDLNYERYVHVFLFFRCIFLICSCQLNKNPSLCELF